jgi:hypothetical protein
MGWTVGYVRMEIGSSFGKTLFMTCTLLPASPRCKPETLREALFKRVVRVNRL